MDSHPGQPAQQQSQHQASDMQTWVFIWAVALAAFLLIPICATGNRRQLCLRRLKERRWNVSLEGETQQLPRPASRNQTSEAEESKPTERLSKQEEEDIRQSFLTELLKDYSRRLTKTDIRRKPKNLEANQVHEGSQNEIANGATFVNDNLATAVISPYSPIEDNRLPNESMRSLPSSLSPGVDDIESTIVVPLSGATCQAAMEEMETREVPNGCSICYCEYGADEMVTWSANPACGHVFHEDCVLTWFMAVGKKELKRRRRAGIEPCSADPVEQVRDFPILCPCCRQTFVSAVKEDRNSTKDMISDCPTSITADSSPSTPHVFGDQNV